MLESIITSKTRMKLLLKLFLNPDTKAYLRGLSEEFGESTNAVRIELNRLTEAGLLESENEGRTKLYKANILHPLFPEIHNIVKKTLGIDKLIETILNHLGKIDLALVTGDYAQGIDSGIIDLVIVGEIDKTYLQFLVEKAEQIIERKIRTLVLNSVEFIKYQEKLEKNNSLILWSDNKAI
ncbi:MAG: winged helix-turn-helix domain-containing protein [Bacillota bacterium]